MSWIEKLYETYERCAGRPQFQGHPIIPPFHSEQQAHLEVVLDGQGNFRRAYTLKKETTPIPVTESSAGRSGTKPVPHPLCDKLQYCAGDYPNFGGAKGQYDLYLRNLQDWHVVNSNPKIEAVLNYIQRGTLVSDLLKEGQLYCGPDHKLLKAWTGDGRAPALFGMLSKKKDKDTGQGKIDQGDAFIRWRVEMPGDPLSALWDDREVRDSWILYQRGREGTRGTCMVTGDVVTLGANHAKRLRHPADGAKLLSSNDASGFTFRGRFEKPEQAYGVGAEVSQKAHNTLRWLIDRQGHRAGEAVFVAWDVGGHPIPDPFADTASILGDLETPSPTGYTGDVGQLFADRLSKMISGYRADLVSSAGIVVMGLDAATPGRLAIIFYRELSGSEFLDRVSAWHSGFAWHQHFSPQSQFTGAPAPRDIVECVYGYRAKGKLTVEDKIRKATVERLLPSILDARPVPRDLVESACRRVTNSLALEKWDLEKCLGVACSLWRGTHPKEDYRMSLEPNRTTRDYLFGRLLAIAENIEERALNLADEQRDTNAAKLLQRFAMRPNSTWRTIELTLAPYKGRLRTNRPGVMLEREKLLDQVLCLFEPTDFTSDAALSGEFLLGYHCQRAALWLRNSEQPKEHKIPGENDEQLTK